MVKPVGYDAMWQKFENSVLERIKTKLSAKFAVEWEYTIREGMRPDVVALMECNNCGNEVCRIPALIFDAYCKWKIDPKNFDEKDKQMKRYSNVCDTVLVMPSGYQNRPYCRNDSDEYHIVSFPSLTSLLDAVLSESQFASKEEMCGDIPTIDTQGVFKKFELQIRSRVDVCPQCNSLAFPMSLIYCEKYDEHYHPDSLDFIEMEHDFVATSYAECDGCGDQRMFGWNFDECPHSAIVYKYQCKKCGAIFDPDTNKIVDNFEPSHRDFLAESLDYYKSKD